MRGYTDKVLFINSHGFNGSSGGGTDPSGYTDNRKPRETKEQKVEHQITEIEKMIKRSIDDAQYGLSNPVVDNPPWQISPREAEQQVWDDANFITDEFIYEIEKDIDEAKDQLIKIAIKTGKLTVIFATAAIDFYIFKKLTTAPLTTGPRLTVPSPIPELMP